MVAGGGTEYIHRQRTSVGIKRGLIFRLSGRGGQQKRLFKTLVFQLEDMNRLTQEKFVSGQATSTQTSGLHVILE